MFMKQLKVFGSSQGLEDGISILLITYRLPQTNKACKTKKKTCPNIIHVHVHIDTKKCVKVKGLTMTTTNLIAFQGSTHSTIYTWDFGDNEQPLIDLGLDKTKIKTHIFKKAGSYKIMVVAKNSIGMESCTITVKVEGSYSFLR